MAALAIIKSSAESLTPNDTKDSKKKTKNISTNMCTTSQTSGSKCAKLWLSKEERFIPKEDSEMTHNEYDSLVDPQTDSYYLIPASDPSYENVIKFRLGALRDIAQDMNLTIGEAARKIAQAQIQKTQGNSQ